jgi:hypothetical protein
VSGIVPWSSTRTLRDPEMCGRAERSGMGTGGSESLDRGADLGVAAPDVPSLPFLFPFTTEAIGPPLLLELAPRVALDLPRLVWTDCSAVLPSDCCLCCPFCPFCSPSVRSSLSGATCFSAALPKIPARTSGSEGPAPLEAVRRCCGPKPIPDKVRRGIAVARAARYAIERHSMDWLSTGCSTPNPLQVASQVK